MQETIAYLLRHGYLVLFLWVFTEQIGLPLPSVPLLLAAGALVGTGHLHLAPAILLPVLAALASDLLWYELGRRRGIRVLQFLCRVSLEPDSCVRRAETSFARHGARSLLLAKFIPGLNTAAPPLAGIFQMRFSRFLLYDALGAVVWAAGLVGLGLAFADQMEFIAGRAVTLGSWLLVLLLGSLGGYIAWKYVHRRRFLRQLSIARISPEELKQKLNAGEDVLVVDLRHSLDFEAEPSTIPGAIRLDAEKLAEHDQIPRDREVVLYCT